MHLLILSFLMMTSLAEASEIPSLPIVWDEDDRRASLTVGYDRESKFVYFHIGINADTIMERRPLYRMEWAYKDEKTGVVGPWVGLVNTPDGIYIANGFGLTILAENIPHEMFGRLKDLTVLVAVNPVADSRPQIYQLSVSDRCATMPDHFIDFVTEKKGCP